MSDRAAHASEAFFYSFANGAATPGWLAGGAFPDSLMEMQRDGAHIPPDHLASARRFLDCLQACHGDSVGVVGMYGERVQTSFRQRLRPSGGAGNERARALMERVIAGLRSHERALLMWLIIRKELPRGALADLGRQASAYRTSKTTRAYTVGRISALLATIHELSALPA